MFNFAQHAVNWDTIISAMEAHGKKERRYRIDIGTGRYSKYWYEY